MPGTEETKTSETSRIREETIGGQSCGPEAGRKGWPPMASTQAEGQNHLLCSLAATRPGRCLVYTDIAEALLGYP